MSSGKFHDRISLLMFAPVAIASVSLIPEHAIALTLSYTAGFLWLSPDMDLAQSNPLQRWGVFRALWAPYYLTHKHRGVSHWPLVGSFVRLVYLAVLVFITMVLLALAGIDASFLMPSNQAALLLYVGVEVSCLLHLFCDYTFLNKF